MHSFDQCYTVQYTSRFEFRIITLENFQIIRFRGSPFLMNFLLQRQVPTSPLRTASILV